MTSTSGPAKCMNQQENPSAIAMIMAASAKKCIGLRSRMSKDPLPTARTTGGLKTSAKNTGAFGIAQRDLNYSAAGGVSPHCQVTQVPQHARRNRVLFPPIWQS